MPDSNAPHELERTFGMNANDILNVVLQNNRCLMNLKGAIAQEHLRRHITKLQQHGEIERFESIDRDGRPDFRIWHRGGEFLLECKNVQKRLNRLGEMTVDFMRTRNPIERPQLRYYSPDEFHVLAVCTFNQTQTWSFKFIRTGCLSRHPDYPDRLSNKVSLGNSAPYHNEWTDDLIAVLERL